MNHAVLDYLTETYAPHAILVYGSYANGTANEQSDFDALLITDRHCTAHDGGRIDGVLLDVFIFHTSQITEQTDCGSFLQVHDALVLLDARGQAARLKERVAAYVRSRPPLPGDEKRHLVEWCEKMLIRATRCDAEGYYRWHWLLNDSLELYFLLRDRFYFGPKKALGQLQTMDPPGYALFYAALSALDHAALSAWISYVTCAVSAL